MVSSILMASSSVMEEFPFPGISPMNIRYKVTFETHDGFSRLCYPTTSECRTLTDLIFPVSDEYPVLMKCSEMVDDYFQENIGKFRKALMIATKVRLGQLRREVRETETRLGHLEDIGEINETLLRKASLENLQRIVEKIDNEFQRANSLITTRLPMTYIDGEPARWYSIMEIAPHVFKERAGPGMYYHWTQQDDIDYIHYGTGHHPQMWYQAEKLTCDMNAYLKRVIPLNGDLEQETNFTQVPRNISIGKKRFAFGAIVRAIDCIAMYISPQLVYDIFMQEYPRFVDILDSLVRRSGGYIQRYQIPLIEPRRPSPIVIPSGDLRTPVYLRMTLPSLVDMTLDSADIPADILTTRQTVLEDSHLLDEEDPVTLVDFKTGDVIHKTNCCGKNLLHSTIEELYRRHRRDIRCPMCRARLFTE